MKHLQIEKRLSTDWSMRFVDDTDYDTLCKENITVTKPDGSPLLVLLKAAIPDDVNALAWSALKKFNTKTDARGVATGIKSEKLKYSDKHPLAGQERKKSAVKPGWAVISGTVGYFERTVRFPYCHSCGWNQQHPDEFAKVLPLCETVNALFKQHVPDRWHQQREVANRTNPAWLIGDTVFSTVTVNKNFRTSCHKDAGDLPEGFSCLSVIRQGTFTGGHLVFPDFRVAAELKTGDLILFDPHEFHGNTMIVPLSKGAQRLSLVYYMREKVQQCLSPGDELSYAKARKRGDPLWSK